MSVWKALLLFGLPALLFRLSLYNGLPVLIRLGMPPFEAWVVSFTVPAAILFALAFGFYKRDGYRLSWNDIKTRFRLLPLSGKDWLWAVGGFLVTFLSIGAFGVTALMLVDAIPAIAPPDFFPPWLKPGVNFDTALFADYIGAPLKNNWGVAVLFFITLFFNIGGEELWWRGYILPRQEKKHGRSTWLVHAQRRQNTWVALIIHLQNGIVLLIVLAMVLGIM
jgi:membrane protease YdiL (CAAX protease family)